MTHFVRWAGLGVCCLIGLVVLEGFSNQRIVDQWVSEGTLQAGRTNACSAVLPDGRILIAGGGGPSGPLATAEAYALDGTSASLASMKFARANHTCVVLEDGRILAVGGQVATGASLNTAEIYDPSAGTWTETAPMAIPRSGATASLFKINRQTRVLITGGDSGGGPTVTMEIFNPEAGTFTLAPVGMTMARKDHAAAVLADGRVLIAGGSNGSNGNSAIRVDVFNPVTGLTERLGSLTVKRAGLTATTLLDGRVFLAGGNNGSADQASADVYDPTTGKFTTVGLQTGRSGHVAVRIPNNNTVILAGGSSNEVPLASAERFTPWTNQSKPVGPLSSARLGLTGAAPDGAGVLVVGGGTTANATKGLSTGWNSAVNKLEGMLSPTLATDKDDYQPGEPVRITGSNWQPGETVKLLFKEVNGPGHEDSFKTVVADAQGNISNSEFAPEQHDLGVAFLLIGTGQSSGRGAQVAFTDGATSLSQCANGGVGDAPEQCINNNWVSGNLGPSKSHYLEGDSIPYRLTVTNLAAGTHTLIIEWDTTKGGKHAIDYITSYNRTELNADACSGFNTCLPVAASGNIPQDPNVPFDQIDGVITVFGAGASNVSLGTYTRTGSYGSDSSTQIPISFTTASAGNVVIAWGGHIATHHDWGEGSAAINISGSPYHTRLVDLDGTGGNQDRSLSAAAVIFPASISIVKDATPEGSTSFPFTASPSPLVNFSLADDGTSANTRVFSGITTFQDYTVAETPIPGGWTLTGINCNVTSANGGNATVSNPSVTISVKEGENWTCTYNNTRQTRLTLVKTITNNNGGTAAATAWTLSASGSTPISGATGSAAVTNALVNAGIYNLNETGGPSGYTPSDWSCVFNGAGSPIIGTPVTLIQGDDVVCTINNDDQGANLIIIKNVVDDSGGGAVAGDFAGTITGSATFASGQTWSGTAAPGQTKVMTAAGTYNVVENAAAGYTASYSGDCSGNIALGETKTCTVTNDDQPANLIIIKNVINDDGGSSGAGAFSGTISGTATFAGGQTWTGAVTPGQTKAMTAAGTYNVVENAAAGYNVSYSTDCSGSIALGQTKTCTVTNDDQLASLIIIKNVINDSGGVAGAGAFSGSITGTATFAGGQTWTGTVTPGQNKTMTAAGTYNVVENPAAGYTTTYSADCTGTIALGETKTCTVTNDDQPANLIIIKNVINNSGGTAAAGAFSGSITGTATFAGGQTWTGTVTPGQTKAMTAAGTYNVVENAFAGYTASYSADCTGSIALGATKTCTVTNDDQPANLIIIKSVINDDGGSSGAGAFSGTISGTATFDGGQTWTGAVTPGQTKAMTAAGTYNVVENAAAGYNVSYSADCSGSIALGQTKTCTVTNNDQDTTLTVIKRVVNGTTGATTLSSAFTMNVTAVNPSDASFPGSETGTTIDVEPGAFNVTESGPSGYSANFVGCSGTIALGESKTCTITNTAIAPRIRVNKVLAPSNDLGLFNLRIDGATAGTGANVGDGGTTGLVPVTIGAHTTGETAGNGTTLSNYIAVNSCAAGVVNAVLGVDYTCVITNTRKGAARVIKTFNTLTMSETDPEITFNIRQGASTSSRGTPADGLGSGTATFANGGVVEFDVPLVPGETYQMCEVVYPGYAINFSGTSFFALFNPNGDFDSEVCINFTVGAGETKTFNVDNFVPPGEGGLGSTIGFWKNHSSCKASKGKQGPILDLTLFFAENFPATPGGIKIGILDLDGTQDGVNPFSVVGCEDAVSILNKSTIDGLGGTGNNGGKQANDPGFNLAAQLLANDLNMVTGTVYCQGVVQANQFAHAILANHLFDGYVGHQYIPFNATEAAFVNALSQILDLANNNSSGACNGVPGHPVITSPIQVVFNRGVGGTFHVEAAGVPAPSIAVAPGDLPPGVTFAAGVLTYDGNVAATTTTVTITATNLLGTSTQSLTIKIVDWPPEITSSNAVVFNVGVAGTFDVTAVGSPVPGITLTSGTLPAGVTFAPAAGTAVLTYDGIGGVAGPVIVEFTATNTEGTDTQTFTVTIQ